MLILTPSTPEFNKADWKSPSPLPTSFLPNEPVDDSAVDGLIVPIANGDHVRKGRRKAPTLNDLSSLLRRQNPEKYEASLTLNSIQPDPTSINDDVDPLTTRRRLSISISNALVRRQSIDTSSTIPEGVNLSRRGSNLPSLASLGARLLERRGSFRVEEVQGGENKENEGIKVEDKGVQALPSSVIPSKKTSATPSESSLGVPSHPLQDNWTFYFSRRQQQSPESKLDFNTIGDVSTLESFGPLFNYLKRPSQLDLHTSIYIFKKGVEPDSSHEMNKKGGRFVLRIKGDSDGSLVDRSWIYLVLALVGDSLGDDSNFITGADVSIVPTFSNPRSPVLQLWINDSSIEHLTFINTLGIRLLKLLELDSSDHQIQFSFIPTSTITSTSLIGREGEKKKVSSFVSIDTFKKISTSSSAGNGWRDRVKAGGIVGGALVQTMPLKNSPLTSLEKGGGGGGWRERRGSNGGK